MGLPAPEIPSGGPGGNVVQFPPGGRPGGNVIQFPPGGRPGGNIIEFPPRGKPPDKAPNPFRLPPGIPKNLTNLKQNIASGGKVPGMPFTTLQFMDPMLACELGMGPCGNHNPQKPPEPPFRGGQLEVFYQVRISNIHNTSGHLGELGGVFKGKIVGMGIKGSSWGLFYENGTKFLPTAFLSHIGGAWNQRRQEIKSITRVDGLPDGGNPPPLPGTPPTNLNTSNAPPATAPPPDTIPNAPPPLPPKSPDEDEEGENDIKPFRRPPKPAEPTPDEPEPETPEEPEPDTPPNENPNPEEPEEPEPRTPPTPTPPEPNPEPPVPGSPPAKERDKDNPLKTDPPVPDQGDNPMDWPWWNPWQNPNPFYSPGFHPDNPFLPDLPPGPNPNPDPNPNPNPPPGPDPNPNPDPNPDPNPPPGPDPNPDPNPPPGPDPNPNPDPDPDPNPPPGPDPNPNPDPDPDPNPPPGPDPNPNPNPDPNPNPNPPPGPNPNLPPGPDPNPPPGPNPNPGPEPNPPPGPNPNPNPTPLPDEDEMSDCDPCSAIDSALNISISGYIETQDCEKNRDIPEGTSQEQINELLTKRIAYQGKGLEGLSSQIEALAELINMLREDICNIDNSSHALVPEWWQVRRGGDIPQLVVVYAQILGNNKKGSYFTLTVPHFLESQKAFLSKNPPPNYRKGDEQIIVAIDDNSKFIANCFSEQEAERLWNFWKRFIDKKFMKKPLDVKIGPRKGKDLKDYKVKPVYARFFDKGQENTIPKWEIKWDK